MPAVSFDVDSFSVLDIVADLSSPLYDLDFFKEHISTNVHLIHSWRANGELNQVDVTDLQMVSIAALYAADQWNKAHPE